MSFDGLRWAMRPDVKAGGSGPKATLMAIADLVDKNLDHMGWMSQKDIGERSENSPDSIQRHIRALEPRGLVRRIPLRTFGRNTIDVFILPISPLIDASLDEIQAMLPAGLQIDRAAAARCGYVAAKCGYISQPQNAATRETPSPSPAAESPQNARPHGAATWPQNAVSQPQTQPHGAAATQPHGAADSLRKTPETPIPPTPLAGGGFDDFDFTDWTNKFLAAYPGGATQRRPKIVGAARRLHNRRGLPGLAWALAAAPLHAGEMAKHPRRIPLNADRWLEEDGFANYPQAHPDASSLRAAERELIGEARGGKHVDPRWAAACEDLHARVGEDIFRSWFALLRLDNITDGVALLLSPSKLIADWVMRNYEPQLLAALRMAAPEVSRAKIEHAMARDRRGQLANGSRPSAGRPSSRDAPPLERGEIVAVVERLLPDGGGRREAASTVTRWTRLLGGDVGKLGAIVSQAVSNSRAGADAKRFIEQQVATVGKGAPTGLPLARVIPAAGGQPAEAAPEVTPETSKQSRRGRGG